MNSTKRGKRFISPFIRSFTATNRLTNRRFQDQHNPPVSLILHALLEQRVAEKRTWHVSSDGASSGSAGVCNKAAEDQQRNHSKTDDAGSLPQPRLDIGVSALDCHQTRKSGRDPDDQDDVTQNAERPWAAGRRCRRNKDETKGDSDHGDEIEHAGSDGAFDDPDEARGRGDAENAEGDDEQAENEG